MIEKIKCFLERLLSCRKLRVGCIAVITALSIVAVTLLSCSIHTVEIFDGETTYTVRTLNRNTANVISGLNLKYEDYSILDTTVSGSTTSVEIAYTYPVYITNGDNTIEIEFSAGTVKDALEKAGFEVDKYDLIEPAADTEITDTVYIDYINVDYVKGSYEKAIPYKTKTVYSSATKKGVTKYTEGKDGLKQVNFTEKFVNGESVERKVTGTTVLEKPVNAKKTIGTKVVKKAVKTSSDVKSISWLKPSFEIKLDKNGNPVNYKYKRTARATAYTYTGNNCSTGVAPKPGYIAVNPNVIPYGTKMYIKTSDGKYIYGYAVAADTGGFIRNHPTGVDLFMTTKSACTNFGVRTVEIYILE